MIQNPEYNFNDLSLQNGAKMWESLVESFLAFNIA